MQLDPHKRISWDERRRKATVYDVLVVRRPSIPIMDKFQPGCLVITEGSSLYSKKIGKIFSAVRPSDKHKPWWNSLLMRSESKEVHWLS